jgi:hypothetical protein
MSVEINPASEQAPTARTTRVIGALRQEHWLSMMLVALHGGLILELAEPLARALLTTHFGLFLLWQPLWRGEQRLVVRQVVLILVAGCGYQCCSPSSAATCRASGMSGSVSGRCSRPCICCLSC